MSVSSRLRATPILGLASAVRRIRPFRRSRPAGPELRFWQEPLTDDHERLLQLIASTFLTKKKLPTWQGLRNELGVASTEAVEIFRSLPGIHRTVGIYGADYGYVRTGDDVTGMNGLPDTVRLALTVAGWWRTGHQMITDQFLIILQTAVRKWRDSQPDITESVQVTFTDQDLPDLGDGGTGLTSVDLYEALQREPPFWQGRNGSPTGWAFNLDDRIERYASVATIEDYLAALCDYAEERNRAAQTMIPSFRPPDQPPPVRPPRRWIRAISWTTAVVVLGGAEDWARGDVIAVLEWLQHRVMG